MKQIYSLGSLSFLLTRQHPDVTIGDIKEAANSLTLDCSTVMNYLEGKGWDIIIATDLIAFFQQRIDARA